MSNSLRAILFSVLGTIVAAEMAWKYLGRFDVDMQSYGLLAIISLAFLLSSLFCEHIRKNPSAGSMLFGLGFLLIFSASVNVISYFGLTIAGPRIDRPLAAIDRAMGIDWTGLMLFIADHPALNFIFKLAYRASFYETILVMIWWGWSDRTRLTEQLCLALVIGGVTTVTVWLLVPSFGAFTVYAIPEALALKNALVLNADYAKTLLNLWAHGPGHISPLTVKGLVGFPSFHAAQAIITTWYARKTKYLFAPFLAFNTVVILSTPIQGGHHVVDVIGGFAVAALAIWLATLISNRLTEMATGKESVPALAAAG
jgi:membrane-associated phospholipid phosphatase